MDPKNDPHIWLAILLAEDTLLSRKERNQRRKDGYTLPAGVYECLEDIGRIEGAIDALKRVWHCDDDNYRKGMMHLSRLAWELRKKLKDYL